MTNIALISCGSKKLEYRARAQDMYISPLFKKSLQYARDILKPEKIYILSAKHGLLKLETEIEPYNKTLNNMPSRDKTEWAENVYKQLKKETDINTSKYIFLAGRNYYKYLVQKLPCHEILMEGLQIGKRLQWLKEKLNEC